MVFPGGDFDAMRPTLSQNVIDFSGRTGYVRAAIDAGVPIVPMVSIGGQETQLLLTRGTGLAKRVGSPFHPLCMPATRLRSTFGGRRDASCRFCKAGVRAA